MKTYCYQLEKNVSTALCDRDGDDQELWQRGLKLCKELYDALEPTLKLPLDQILERSMRGKARLMELVTAAGSGAICRTCGGECCLYGKYHVTVLDILACYSSGSATCIPDFSRRPACPYSNADGCLMPPALRPVTCNIFNCELLENVFTSDVSSTIQALEQELRMAVTESNRLIGIRLDRPLLLWSAEAEICR